MSFFLVMVVVTACAGPTSSATTELPKLWPTWDDDAQMAPGLLVAEPSTTPAGVWVEMRFTDGRMRGGAEPTGGVDCVSRGLLEDPQE